MKTCGNYKILNDPKRNANYKTVESVPFCDSTTSSWAPKSADWKGKSWYRFQFPAGTRIPEYVVPHIHCGTYATGWLNGTHPTEYGNVSEATVCFHYTKSKCQWTTQIQILNCGQYFLYQLQDAPECRMKFCGV